MSFSRLPAASALFRLRPSRRVFVAAFLAGLILAWGAASLGAAVPAAAGSGRSPRTTPAIAAESRSPKFGYDSGARSVRPSSARPRLSLRAPAVRIPSSLLSAGSTPSTP